MTNRKKYGIGRFVGGIADASKGYYDMTAMKKIEELADDISHKVDVDESATKAHAIYNSMTERAQDLYRSRMEEILRTEERSGETR